MRQLDWCMAEAKQNRWGWLHQALAGAATSGAACDALFGVPPGRCYGLVHHAAYFDNVAVLGTLLEHGASASVRTKDGQTAADIARGRRARGAAALLDRLHSGSGGGGGGGQDAGGKKRKRDHEPGHQPWKLVLAGDDGNAYEFRLTSDAAKTAIFRLPVFFCERAHLSSRQGKAQPTLLVSSDDWAVISRPDVTHKGAFGSDFHRWTAKKCLERQVLPASTWRFTDDKAQRGWVAVWKFPGDLMWLPGFQPILGVPLPVGYYPFYDDHDQDKRWWAPGHRSSDPEMPRGADTVEKLRCDYEHGPSVHHLENSSGEAVAMIGSTYFIRNLWSVTGEERRRVNTMLQRLYHRARVEAFPCYGQHHAIVFYVDLDTGRRITPGRLSTILAESPRGAAVQDALAEAAVKPRAIPAWARQHVRQFAPG